MGRFSLWAVAAELALHTVGATTGLPIPVGFSWLSAMCKKPPHSRACVRMISRSILWHVSAGLLIV